MGCGSSKAAIVAPQNVTKAWTPQDERGNASPRSSRSFILNQEQDATKPKRNSLRGEKVPVDARTLVMVQENNNKAVKNERISSGNSTSGTGSSASSCIRLSSATSMISKGSAHTDDSGLGDEYACIITEKSNAQVQKVAKVPEDLEAPDLTIEGLKIVTSAKRKRAIPTGRPPISNTKTSAGANQQPPTNPLLPRRHTQVTFANELHVPDSPDIIKRPSSRGGMAYDILLGENPAESSTTVRRKPVGLKKLEQRKRRKDAAELDAKQKAAECRRKVMVAVYPAMQLLIVLSRKICLP